MGRTVYSTVQVGHALGTGE